MSHHLYLWSHYNSSQLNALDMCALTMMRNMCVFVLVNKTYHSFRGDNLPSHINPSHINPSYINSCFISKQVPKSKAYLLGKAAGIFHLIKVPFVVHKYAYQSLIHHMIYHLTYKFTSL